MVFAFCFLAYLHIGLGKGFLCGLLPPNECLYSWDWIIYIFGVPCSLLWDVCWHRAVLANTKALSLSPAEQLCPGGSVSCFCEKKQVKPHNLLRIAVCEDHKTIHEMQHKNTQGLRDAILCTLLSLGDTWSDEPCWIGSVFSNWHC